MARPFVVCVFSAAKPSDTSFEKGAEGDVSRAPSNLDVRGLDLRIADNIDSEWHNGDIISSLTFGGQKDSRFLWLLK
ncbi:Hypothetical predicted protein [Podarcis lilfordi]|uniref:Uncharacterized protein n=1 Tax=Podarcis lilfordi TaxID=74358 RepID=A0AA35LJA3_9SAUR|nr:Hypothetical predicted protein [Podarcis lilfordi]